ncbi:MAG: sensor histidine kinase [Spirochaetaceae bacterium]|nr:sensor histidine kinase [Spirochaetaceae bacterium]
MDVIFTSGDHQKREALLTIQSRNVLESQDERELFISVTDITKQKDDEKRIQTLLDEKEIFLKEIHHRVKNNMNSIISLISIEMALYPDMESTRLLQDIIGRIRSMSHLYNRLLEAELYDKVDFSLYMEGLIEQIRRVYPYQGTISVTTRFDDFTIDPQRVFPLGLIVNELYCNAVKHAFPDGRDGSVQFEASYNDGTVTFRYKDNGPRPETGVCHICWYFQRFRGP